MALPLRERERECDRERERDVPEKETEESKHITFWNTELSIAIFPTLT